MKYGTLILAAAVTLVAVAPPPPPPTPAPSTNATASPAPLSSDAPATSASPDATASATPAPGTGLPSVDIFGNGKTIGTPKPKGSPTPPPNDRKGLDGVWEIAIQPIGSDAFYEHLFIKQTGQALAGTYLTQDKKKYPLAGALDGTQVRMVVTLPDGSTIIFEGKVDGTTDMVGMLTNAKGRTPFTAAYRPKEKWIDNVNASPGGLGGGGGYPPR